MGFFERGWLRELLARGAAARYDQTAPREKDQDEMTTRAVDGVRLGRAGTAEEVSAALTEMAASGQAVTEDARYSWILTGAMMALCDGHSENLQVLFFHDHDSRLMVMDEMMRKEIDPQNLIPFFFRLPPEERSLALTRDMALLAEHTHLEDKTKVADFIAGAADAVRAAERLYRRAGIGLVS